MKNSGMNMGRNISNYTIYFIFYCMIGWIYEVFLEVVVYEWGFSNRGVLFGPWLPVYGIGAITFCLLWYRLIKDKPIKQKLIRIPLIFLLTMITATLIELVASYLCEWTIGSWPWQTYVDYQYNFQGRIALSPSIRFGLGGVVFLYLVQPFLDRIVGRLSDKQSKGIAWAIAAVLIVDGVYSFVLK